MPEQLTRLRAILQRARNSRVAQNTVWMLCGHLMRTAIQAVYFVLIARALGVDGYGAFGGVAAFMGVAAPFASLGCGNIMIKHVARDRAAFGMWWGNALAMTSASGMALVGVVLCLSRWVLPGSISLLLVLALAASELIFARLLDVSGQAYQAVERLERTAQLQVVQSFLKLGAVLILVGFAEKSVIAWGMLYLVSSAASAAVGVYMVHRELGRPKLGLGHLKREILEGFYFSVSLSGQNIYNDIDKTMMVRYSTLADAGTYCAAYRLIDISFTPVRSLLWASYAGFFKHGAAGLGASLKYARRLMPMAGIYGLGAGVVLYVAAPVVPWILGREYETTVAATRWLALLPLLKSVHFFAADTLTGAGYQGLRSAIQLGVALFNIGINFWLIPAYSWRGAAWSSLLSDGLLAACLWAVLWYLSRNRVLDQPAPAPRHGGHG